MSIDGAAFGAVALALGLGLLIGLERERRKGRGPTRQFAGVRTFTLVALLGAVVQLLAQDWLIVVAAALVVLLAVISHLRARSRDPGVTTEIALFLTYVLGLLSVSDPALAAAGGVLVAALLAARGPLQAFATHTLTEQELRNALILAAAALVILPLTPDRPIAGVNPRQAWQLVVLILAVQAVGDVALRWLGARLGLALSGLVSGLVSSTATIAALGARARKESALLSACVAGACLSTVSTGVLMIVITALLAPAMLAQVAPTMGAAATLALILGLLAYRRTAPSSAVDAARGRAFSLWQAMMLALLISGIAALVAWLRDHAGTTAVLLMTAVAGLADAHSAAAGALTLAARGGIDGATLAMAVLLAFSANNLSKAIVAWTAGGYRYGLVMTAALVLMAGVAWAVWAFLVRLG